MLLSVYIENIALIKKLSLDIDNGFCAFTGETGAGKSIIIDSLGLLCGARSDKEIIRTGEESALVEGIFEIDDEYTKSKLAEMEIEPEEDGCITVTRKISRDGKSSAKINGRSANLSKLKSAVSMLLSIHGQQDTQAFADTDRQREMLDSFAGNEEILSEYKEKYAEYCAIRSKLEKAERDTSDREFKLDMLKFKINELKKAKIKVGEKAELQNERNLLANSERIVSRSGEAYSLLYAMDGSAAESIEGALNAVNSLIGIVEEAESLSERLESAKYEIIDIAETVKEYTESDGENVERRLDECETRLELIKKLEHKYKTEADELPALFMQLMLELDENENGEAMREKLVIELEAAKKELSVLGRRLGMARAEAAKQLTQRVTEELCELDMPGVRFELSITEKEFSENGCDDVEFLISANKGELPKPMSKIASGGELSRIMLCLKCVFADTEAIGTLIFDEIDTGVSGRTSEKIGMRLKSAANGKKTQVICVTHSAILAAKADSHYKISKSETDGRVLTSVKKLDHLGRRDELARIMGGLNISETVLKAAEEMLS